MAKKAKDPAAQALAAKRWENTTEEQRSEHAREMNESRWANKTDEQRAAHGQMLADARAKARKKRKPAQGKKG